MMEQIVLTASGLLQLIAIISLYSAAFAVWWLVRPRRHAPE